MIVVVYNPRSSKAKRVRAEVLDVLEAEGREYKTYEVLPTNVDDNAKKLAKKLRAGDVVITAGGDGTATIGLNGVVLSGKKVRLAVMPYGNFNDTARLLGCRNVREILAALDAGRTRRLYPLEAMVNGKHYRYAACYFTIGMFAESTEIFDRPTTRKSLQGGKKSLVFSAWNLFLWWCQNRKKAFFPEDFPYTDVLAVNGGTVAKVMRGDKELAFSREGFVATRQKLSGIFGILWFMTRSMARRVPGKIARDVRLEFSREYEVEIQAEGEYARKKVRQIKIQKLKRGIEVLVRR